MSIPVAMIPYANMAPYRQMGPPQGCHFLALVPRASIQALMEGRVVAAAVPVGGLARLGDRVETVGRFGIAAKGPAMSVLLFTQVPFAQMQAPHTLRLTGESATSVRLLYLLLGHTVGFGKLPHIAAEKQSPAGELLIGDRALIKNMAATTRHEWAHVTDLARTWFDIHRWPFVFARWVVRSDAPDTLKQEIAGWLDQFRERESEFVKRAIPATAEQLHLDEAVIQRYFQAIRRCLDDEDLQGQQLFSSQLERFGREPLFQSSSKTE